MAGLSRRLCILGATGSVGRASLSVVEQYPDIYQVDALVACDNVLEMERLCRKFSPNFVVMTNESKARILDSRLKGLNTIVESGDAGVLEAIQSNNNDTIISAIAGASGIPTTLAAAATGKRLLLANKESLVVGGKLVLEAIQKSGGELLPVDSEHCALYDLLQGRLSFKRLWLTASGGAVRDLPLSLLSQVTPKMALSHPNWSMGTKITVDSATMMNKALEVIEAAVLFQASSEEIAVIMHPQSIYHAFVEYADGMLSASISTPDMRLSIARMLAWPHHLENITIIPTWQALSGCSFEMPNEERYPCLALAYQALKVGGAAPAVLSTANEVAVEGFLMNRIKFTDIARINTEVLQTLVDYEADTIESIWAVEEEARVLATEMLC